MPGGHTSTATRKRITFDLPDDTVRTAAKESEALASVSEDWGEILRPWFAGPPDPHGDQRAWCPLHEIVGKSTPSASINLELETWNCFAGCKTPPLNVLVAHVLTLSPEDVPKPRRLRKNLDKVNLPSAAKVEAWHQRLMNDEGVFQEWRELLAARGISRDTLREHRIGGDARRITIPVYVDGELKNVRYYSPDHKPKFTVVPGNSTAWLYPHDEFVLNLGDDEPIVVVEGEWDALLLRQRGYHAVTTCTGAGGMPSVIEEHIDLFSGRRVVVWTDADEDGVRAREKIVRILEDSDCTVVGVIQDKGKDATDAWRGLGEERFLERLDAVVHEAWSSASTANGIVDTSSEAYIKELHRQRLRFMARMQVRSELGGMGLRVNGDLRTLRAIREEGIPEPKWTVERLHERGSNTLFAARDKVGKTTLMGPNLMRVLVDGGMFLEAYPVRKIEGRVSYWNYEVGEAKFSRWLLESGIENDELVLPVPLRGWYVPLTTDEGFKWAVDLLKRNEVEVLIVDPLSRVVTHCNLEGTNEDYGRVLDTFDRLKDATDVEDLFVVTHFGHEHERARGPSIQLGWPDSKWILTKRPNSKRRYFAAEGRDVDVPEQGLDFDEKTRHLSMTGSTREDDELEEGVSEIIRVLSGEAGLSKKALRDGMSGRSEKKDGCIEEAVRRGLIERDPEPPVRGKRTSHWLTESGEKVARGVIERDS